MNRPEPTVLADSSLGYTGCMADDQPQVTDQPKAEAQATEVTNRPEPSADLSAPDSESASTQPVQDQPAIPASEPTAAQSTEIPETPPTTEPPQAPQASVDESISTSTSSPIESSGSAAPAQDVPPETEPIKIENQPVQADTEPQAKHEAEIIPPQNQEVSSSPPITPAPTIPSFHFPFYGTYPVTFDFGAQPSDEAIKKKYQEWGITGHNGLDFGLPEGTEVLSSDEGVVTQAGDNGDFGISITIKHSWGTSIYVHLQSFGVLVNDHVAKGQVIALSGRTGFVTGPHLHFGIQPTNSDTSNGYLGYINPSPYLSERSEKPQPEPEKEKLPDLSGELSEEKPQSPEFPQSPQPETPQQDIQQQVDLSAEVLTKAEALFDARLKENSIKGNEVKKAKRDEAIQKIFSFAREKKRITNEQVRDFLHISQSTATDYLSDLVNHGMLKVEGKGKATVYLF